MSEDRKALKEAYRVRKSVGGIFDRKKLKLGTERDG